MALDNVTSHFSTILEPITSASFLSSLSIIHAIDQHMKKAQYKSLNYYYNYYKIIIIITIIIIIIIIIIYSVRM